MRFHVSKTTVVEKLREFLNHKLDEKGLSSWASNVLTGELVGELMPSDIDSSAVGLILLQLEQLDEPEANFSNEEAKYYVDCLEKFKDENTAVLCVHFWPFREKMKEVLQKRMSVKLSHEYFERWKFSLNEQTRGELFHLNLSKLTQEQLAALSKHLVTECDPVKDLEILHQMNLLAGR